MMKESDLKPAAGTTKRNSLLAQSLISVGSAALSSVNALTPHLAGAVDIMVVLQPDGITLRSTPFYVRFGKYAPMRNRERDVKIIVNDDQPAGFKMHLGSYGHAYLLEPANGDEAPPEPQNDDMERADKSDTIEELLPGMMSPATVYSSEGEEEDGDSPKLGESLRGRGKLLPETALGIANALIRHQQRDLPTRPFGNSQGLETQSEFPAQGSSSSSPPSRPQSEPSPRVESPESSFPRLGLEARESLGEGSVWWNHKGQASLLPERLPVPPPSSSLLPPPAVPTHKREASFAIDESWALPTTIKEEADPSIGEEGRSMPISILSSPPLLPSRQTVSLPSSPARPIHAGSNSSPIDDPLTDLLDKSTGPTASNVGPHSSASFSTLELSECGVHLYSTLGLTPLQALRIFESHRVQEDVFRSQGAQLLSSPHLMVRIGDMIYPWRAVSTMVIGSLVFGSQFDNLIPKDTLRWGPLPPKQLQPRHESNDISRPRRRSMSQGRARVSRGLASDTLPSVRFPASDGSLTAGSTMATQPESDSGASPSSSSWTFWPFANGRKDDPLLQGGGGSLGRSKDLSNQVTRKESRPSSQASELVGDGEESKSRKAPPLLMRKTLTPTSEQLSSLGLKPGRNRITYRIGTTALSAYVYLFSWDTKLVISDIDGTITRSDVLGHILPAIGWDWSHKGISQLFTNVVSHGYQIMYLSSRSIGQANITRDYLNTIVQREGKEGGEHRMPLGPVIISPDGILPSLYREMVLRRPHEFKIATLQDIRSLFPPSWNPFYAGFGNRNTDEMSYKTVGVPVSRIFIINPKGELREATTAMGTSPPSSSSPNEAEGSTLMGKVSVDSVNSLASVPSLGAGSVWSLRDINVSVSELFPPIRLQPIAIVDGCVVEASAPQLQGGATVPGS